MQLACILMRSLQDLPVWESLLRASGTAGVVRAYVHRQVPKSESGAPSGGLARGAARPVGADDVRVR